LAANRLEFVDGQSQDCTNPGCLVAVACELYICGSSVWNLLHAPFWSLEFWGGS